MPTPTIVGSAEFGKQNDVTEHWTGAVTGVQAGDLIIITFVMDPGFAVGGSDGWKRIGGTWSGEAVTFTLMDEHEHGRHDMAVFWRVADSHDVDSCQFRWQYTGTGDSETGLIVIRGQHATTPIRSFTRNQSSATNETVSTAPSINVRAGSRILAVIGGSAEAQAAANWRYNAMTTQVGDSVLVDTGQEAPPSSYIYSRLLVNTWESTTTGLTGSRTADTNGATPMIGWTGYQIEIQPPNQPPNAPILTAPADGSTIDRASTQRFDWDFSDPDAGDSQSKYDLRYRRTDVAKNEIQTVTITGSPTGGSFTLTYSEQTTAAIAYDATAASVQTALEALSNIGVGDVTCTGGPLPGTAVTVTFTGALGNTNVAQMTATSSLTGGTTPAVTVATTQEGVPFPAWTDVTTTTPNTYHDFASGTFAAGAYEWQVRTYDAVGLVGPYSASDFFTAAAAPSDLTITYPSNGGTVQQAERVDWSTPTQDSFQVRRVADNAGAADTATVYYDSGEVVSTTARTQALTFETNDRYEHVQVRIKDAGLWSAWASVRVNVSYTPPPAPTVSLMALDDEGSLWVSISNPTPTGGQPSVEYNSVEVNDGDGWERKVTNWATNTGWQYRTPVGGRDYSGNVRVTAHASNGATATTTVPAGAAPTTTDYYGGGYE